MDYSVPLHHGTIAAHTAGSDLEAPFSECETVASHMKLTLHDVVQTCLTYIDRSNVAYGALQFKGDLHLNDQEYGLGAGAYILPGPLFCLGHYKYCLLDQHVIPGGNVRLRDA